MPWPRARSRMRGHDLRGVAHHQVQPAVVGAGDRHRERRLHHLPGRSRVSSGRGTAVLNGRHSQVRPNGAAPQSFRVVVRITLGPYGTSSGSYVAASRWSQTRTARMRAPVRAERRPRSASPGRSAPCRDCPRNCNALGEDGVARHPEGAAGPRRGTTDVGRLLHDEGGESRFVGRQRCGHPGTRADDGEDRR